MVNRRLDKKRLNPSLKKKVKGSFIDDFIAPTSSKEKKIIYSTKGNIRLNNYFNQLIGNSEFNEVISAVRRYQLDQSTKIKDNIRFSKVIRNVCRYFELDEVFWFDDIKNYVLKAKVPIQKNTSTSCVVFDRLEIGEDEYDEEDLDGLEDKFAEPKELESYSYSYPVVLRISPYAKKKEIIDYIRKTYEFYIEPIQASYKKNNLPIKIETIRGRNPKIQQRNKFINDFREQPLKKIKKFVEINFGELLTVGHIGKIISLEKKKRENRK